MRRNPRAVRRGFASPGVRCSSTASCGYSARRPSAPPRVEGHASADSLYECSEILDALSTVATPTDDIRAAAAVIKRIPPFPFFRNDSVDCPDDDEAACVDGGRLMPRDEKPVVPRFPTYPWKVDDLSPMGISEARIEDILREVREARRRHFSPFQFQRRELEPLLLDHPRREVRRPWCRLFLVPHAPIST